MWVVFDFGGVICTPQPEEDLAALAATAGVSVAGFRDAYWQVRTAYDTAALTAASFWQEVAGRLGRSFDGPQIDDLVRLDIASWTHLQEGTVSLVGELAAAGHRLALLSNAPVEVARAVSGLPVARHFAHLLFSCDFKAAKPDASCFGQALGRLAAPPQAVIFIDDRQENVAAAAGMGMRAIRFTRPEQVRARLAGIIGDGRLLFLSRPCPGCVPAE